MAILNLISNFVVWKLLTILCLLFKTFKNVVKTKKMWYYYIVKFNAIALFIAKFMKMELLWETLQVPLLTVALSLTLWR